MTDAVTQPTVPPLPFDADSWALDVLCSLSLAHGVLVGTGDIESDVAWRWWDKFIDHCEPRAGSRPPETPDEVAQAWETYRTACIDEFGWRERREDERARAEASALEARREAAADRDAQEEADAKRAGTWAW